MGQPGGEQGRLRLRARVEDRVDVGVGGRAEGHPFALPIHDKAGGHRLHTAGREPGHDLLPQDRGDLIPVQAVEDPSGLLGVDQVGVELAGVGHGVGDGLGGDLVEHHPPGRNRGLELLEQVPGDRLALAVAVGGEQELVRARQRVLQGADGRLLVRVHDVERLEAVVDIDPRPCPLLALVLGRHLGGTGREVAHVAPAGLHDVTVAEKAGDLGRLGGRLDDHQTASSDFSCHVCPLLLCGHGSWLLGLLSPPAVSGPPPRAR
jgi:hypothetical protein